MTERLEGAPEGNDEGILREEDFNDGMRVVFMVYLGQYAGVQEVTATIRRDVGESPVQGGMMLSPQSKYTAIYNTGESIRKISMTPENIRDYKLKKANS